MVLKPVKIYEDEEGNQKRKANCDVEMAFYLMRDKDTFERVVVLSGDGDFLPVLKYLRDIAKKEVLILARGPRTAKGTHLGCLSCLLWLVYTLPDFLSTILNNHPTIPLQPQTENTLKYRE